VTTLSASVHECSVGRRASGFVQVGLPPLMLPVAAGNAAAARTRQSATSPDTWHEIPTALGTWCEGLLY